MVTVERRYLLKELLKICDDPSRSNDISRLKVNIPLLLEHNSIAIVVLKGALSCFVEGIVLGKQDNGNPQLDAWKRDSSCR